MCAGCAMAAAAGATGARTWLQVHLHHRLTPARLRAVTIALFVAAFGVSTIGLSGSSGSTAHAAKHESGGSAAASRRPR